MTNPVARPINRRLAEANGYESPVFLAEYVKLGRAAVFSTEKTVLPQDARYPGIKYPTRLLLTTPDRIASLGYQPPSKAQLTSDWPNHFHDRLDHTFTERKGLKATRKEIAAELLKPFRSLYKEFNGQPHLHRTAFIYKAWLRYLAERW